jgi:hypothetical protein
MGAHALRRLLTAFVGLTFLAGFIPSILIAQESPTVQPQDLILGSWRLVIAKSRYDPGPAPKSELRTYERNAEGLKATVTREYSNGKSESIVYLANLDSVNPVFGASDYDTVRLKRITDYESEAVLAHADVIFGIARRVVSRDGKTMTISFRRESQRPVYNFAVYEKTAK